MIAVAILALMSTTAAGAAEDIYSANFWMPHCKEIVDRPDSASGVAMYCAGVIEGTAFSTRGSRDPGRCTSAPADASRQQLTRVVVRWIEAHPARMHEPLPRLAIEALKAAWPCRGKEDSR
jgi:hypothetical protein